MSILGFGLDDANTRSQMHLPLVFLFALIIATPYCFAIRYANVTQYYIFQGTSYTLAASPTQDGNGGVQYWFFDTGLVAVLRENQNGFTILRTSTMSPSLSSDVYVAVVGGAKFLAVKGNSVKLLTYSGGTWQSVGSGTITGLSSFTGKWQKAESLNPQDVQSPFYVFASPEAIVVWNVNSMQPVYTIDLRTSSPYINFKPSVVTGMGGNPGYYQYYIAFGSSNISNPGYVLTFSCNFFDPLTFYYERTTYFYASPYNFFVGIDLNTRFYWVEYYGGITYIMQYILGNSVIRSTSFVFSQPNEQWSPFAFWSPFTYYTSLLGSGVPGATQFKLYVVHLGASNPAIRYTATINLGLQPPSRGVTAQSGTAGVVASLTSQGVALAWVVYEDDIFVKKVAAATSKKPEVTFLANCVPSDCDFTNRGSCDPDKCWAILGKFNCCQTPPR